MPPSDIEKRGTAETVATDRSDYEGPVEETEVSERTRFATGDSDTAFQQTEAGTAAPTASILLPARFEMRHSLGVGGMGEVVLAHDRVLGRDVAIKVLKTGDYGDRDMHDRLLNEAQAAAQIRHPHIVNIHDVMPESGLIVMEYLPGGSARALIEKRGHLPISELLPLARKLCSALEAAHAEGLVHRDIKPDNVLFDARGEVKVADFGVAQFRRRTTSGGSEIVGTPAYMAPEQLRGAEPDPRADIYALGLTIYELACGHRFHNPQGPSDHTIPGLARAVGSRHLARILARCLDEDPQRRWSSAKELEQAIAHLAVRRQRVRSWAIAAVLAAVIGVPLAWGLLRDTETTVTLLKVAALPFENRSAETRLNWLREGLANLVTSALRRRDVPTVLHAQVRDQVGSATGAANWEAAARKAGASAMLRGSFEREGAELVVSATLRGRTYEARGKTNRADSIADELASAISKDVAGTKTKSKLKGRPPEATRRYEQGYSALQQHEFQRAIELLREAIRLDEDFIEARYALITAMSSINTARGTLVTEANEALARRLDPKQRALFEALRLRVMRQYGNARALYDKLVSRFPNEKEALFGLAESLFHVGRGDRAMHLFKRLVKLAPGFHLAYKHPVDWLGTRGKAQELSGYLYQLRRAKPPKPFLALMEVRLELARRQYARALTQAARIRPPRSDLLAVMAGIRAIEGKLEEARELFAQASALTPENWNLRIARAALDVSEGRFVEFQNDVAWEIENVGPVAKIANRLSTRGLLYALVGRMEEAQQDLLAVRSIASPEVQLQIPRLLFLEGLVGWAAENVTGLKALLKRLSKPTADRSGRPSETIPFIEGAILAASAKPKLAAKKFREAQRRREGPAYAPVFLVAIARSALAGGDLGQAVKSCEEVLRPTAYSYFRTAAVPPCLGILALIYDNQGSRPEATKYAKALLLLYRGASAEIPEVGYARQVLSLGK